MSKPKPKPKRSTAAAALAAPPASPAAPPPGCAHVDYGAIVAGFDIMDISCSAPVSLTLALGAPNAFHLRGSSADLPLVGFDFSGSGTLRLYWNGPAGSSPCSEILCEIAAPAPQGLLISGDCRARLEAGSSAPAEFKLAAHANAAAKCFGSLSKIKLMASDRACIDALALRAGALMAIGSNASRIDAWATDRLNADLDGNAHFCFRCSGEATVWAEDGARADHVGGTMRKASVVLRGSSRASALRIDGKALLRADKDCAIFYTAPDSRMADIVLDAHDGAKIRRLHWTDDKPTERLSGILDSAHRARAQIAELRKTSNSRA